jgi:uncharacterized protein
MAIVRKIKDKLKKAMPKKGTVRAKVKEKIAKVKAAGRAVRGRRKAAAETSPVAARMATAQQAVIGTQEVAVGKAKFSNPAPTVEMRRLMQELPHRYGQDKIALMVRDPRWLHTYWEVTQQTIDRLQQQLGNSFHGAKLVVRVYDVTNINFNGKNAHRFFDIEVGFHANSWYIDSQGPGRSLCVEVGLLLQSGEFIAIARSNVVHTPLEGASWMTDEEWMVPEEMFARLYGMGFGFGKSSPGKGWQERMRQALFSGALASPGMASMTSPGKKVPRGRKFWFWVNTELIVYGATEPDASLTVQGKEVKLRPDGTFTLRFALPDGKQVIPCSATSSDKVETRTITPIVTRETK